jgi:hypothetical protein
MGRERERAMSDQEAHRRIEKMQTTLFKLIGQLESCKIALQTSIKE